MEFSMQDWMAVAMAVIAFVALVVAYVEYKSGQATAEHKLFSQLNRRYQGNEDIQAVVRYLRRIEPSETMPSPYQTELFLRFFEELWLYVSTNSLKVENVDNFFCYYLRRMYATERGHELLDKLEGDDRELEYLQKLRERLGINDSLEEEL